MVVLTTRPCSVDIEFSDITHCVQISKTEQKAILSHVNGKFEHGKLHAIMGPSGAGKSSLLNVLAGLNYVASGIVTMNGREQFPVAKWSKVVTPIRSYILQDDFMVPELTVRETLLFAAYMNRPQSDEIDYIKLVNALLEQFALTEQGDRRIQSLSGGQRKRVAVAQELVNYKPLLFLDEPTTGLDSTSCYRLVDLLKELASAGCNVIATIHQPSSRVFAIFDTLTVLANGGRLAYSGPPSALAGSIEILTGRTVSPYENPSDVLFEGDTISKMANFDQTVRDLKISQAQALYDMGPKNMKLQRNLMAHIEGEATCFKTPPPSFSGSHGKKLRTASADEIMELCKRTTPSANERFNSIFKRALVQTRRDTLFLLGRFIAMAVGAALIALAFPKIGSDGSKVYGNVTFLFFLSAMLQLGTVVVTVMNSPVHTKIMLRESINSWYGVSTFFWARTIIEVIVAVASAIIFSIIMWLSSGQQQDLKVALPYVIIIMSLHTIASHHVAFCLAIFSDVQSLPQLPFAVTMLHTVFGGYFIPLNNFPNWIIWLRYVNWGSFTYSALMKIAYSAIPPNLIPIKLACMTSAEYDPVCVRFPTGQAVLKNWGIKDVAEDPIWMDAIILSCYLFGFLVIHWALTALYLNRARRAVARL